jgi:hypothetical protein
MKLGPSKNFLIKIRGETNIKKIGHFAKQFKLKIKASTNKYGCGLPI